MQGRSFYTNDSCLRSWSRCERTFRISTRSRSRSLHRRSKTSAYPEDLCEPPVHLTYRSRWLVHQMVLKLSDLHKRDWTARNLCSSLHQQHPKLFHQTAHLLFDNQHLPASSLNERYLVDRRQRHRRLPRTTTIHLDLQVPGAYRTVYMEGRGRM